MKISKTGARMGTFGAVMLAATGLAMAQTETAAPAKPPPPSPEELAWMKELTLLAPGGHKELKPVEIKYRLSWNNVLNAGELDVAMKREPVESVGICLVGTADARSSGLARALWSYDAEAKATVLPGTLEPKFFELAETERGKKFAYQLDFQPRAVSSRTTEFPKKASEDPKVSEKTYRYQAVKDILSTVLYVRSFELTEGETIKTLVSPFNRPYYVALECQGREERKIKGEKHDAIRLGVGIRKVNGNKTLQDYDKMKAATIWLSDDEFRLPLEVHADIFVGFISARMLERAWLE
ncbi:MAG: DUF3108 domain-containing protein [Verrucomicrobiae bacterium]|nr:DUF3108 domain-containing protein [Verrucomicrobiae bacterium]